MAYIDFAARHDDLLALAPRHDPVPADAPATQLSALEWSVVAIARNDRLSSLRDPSRLSVAMGGLFGALDSIRHETVHRWSPDEDTAVLEMICHYLPSGGGPVPLPVMSVLQRLPGDGRVAHLRIYIDMGPLHAEFASVATSGAQG